MGGISIKSIPFMIIMYFNYNLCRKYNFTSLSTKTSISQFAIKTIKNNKVFSLERLYKIFVQQKFWVQKQIYAPKKIVI